MKRTAIILVSAVCFLLTGVASGAEKLPAMDSIAVAIRVKQLEKSRSELKDAIASEDLKRNRKDPSLAPETLELMNIRQDSVCLALRSRLLSVELELGELVPDRTAQALTTLYNTIRPDVRRKED